MRIIVGVICLVFVVNAWRRRRETEPVKKTAASGVFWGTVTGFTSFMMQGGGPPYRVHVLPQRLPKMTLAGTTTVTFAVINSSKILPYMTLVDYTPRVLATSVALLPLAVVSNLLGVWLLRRVPTEAFYKIIYLLLFVVSLAMLVQGGAQIIGSFQPAHKKSRTSVRGFSFQKTGWKLLVLFDEHLLALLGDHRQHDDDQHEGRDRQQRRADRPGEEHRPVAARDQHGAAELVFEQRAEHEAEEERRPFAAELGQEVADQPRRSTIM